MSITNEPEALLTLFFPIFPFDALENIGKPKFFWYFHGGQKGTLGRKGLKPDISRCVFRTHSNIDGAFYKNF